MSNKDDKDEKAEFSDEDYMEDSSSKSEDLDISKYVDYKKKYKKLKAAVRNKKDNKQIINDAPVQEDCGRIITPMIKRRSDGALMSMKVAHRTSPRKNYSDNETTKHYKNNSSSSGNKSVQYKEDEIDNTTSGEDTYADPTYKKNSDYSSSDTESDNTDIDEAINKANMKKVYTNLYPRNDKQKIQEGSKKKVEKSLNMRDNSNTNTIKEKKKGMIFASVGDPEVRSSFHCCKIIFVIILNKLLKRLQMQIGFRNRLFQGIWKYQRTLFQWMVLPKST